MQRKWEMVSNPHKTGMCLTEGSSTVVADSMQKNYSVHSGLCGFLKCNAALLVQGKQQRGKNQVHLTMRILKVEVDPYKATQRAQLSWPACGCLNKRWLIDPPQGT